MIIPGDFKNLTVRPSFKISWVVLFLNVFVFVAILLNYEVWPNQGVREKLNEESFKSSVYEMYIQTLDPIEAKIKNESIDSVYAKALKDEKFWNRMASFPFHGDRVQIDEVKTVMTQFFESYRRSAQFQFGLGSFEISPWSWLTYQFVHASLIHLIGNLVIIFLVMSFLEQSLSAMWVACVYLFSGFVGGIFFLMIDSAGSMSVVGASASASGLLSFLIVLKHKDVVPWFYLIAPIKNGYGKIYLPAFFIFPVFLASDFMSLLWEPNGVAANVAVSAHVGGTLTGFVMGGLYLAFGSKTAAHSVFSDDDGLHELS